MQKKMFNQNNVPFHTSQIGSFSFFKLEKSVNNKEESKVNGYFVDFNSFSIYTIIEAIEHCLE